MFDVVSGSLLGTVVGGIFRLAPEVLSLIDKNSDRKRDLVLALKNKKQEVVQEVVQEVAQEIQEKIIPIATPLPNEEVTQPATTTNDKWSAAVRPAVTFSLVFVWALIHLWAFFTNVPPDTYAMIVNPDFTALVSATVNYWFLDRTFKHNGG